MCHCLPVCIVVFKIAELLLKTVAAWPERVDVNVKDKSGLTPLMHAIEHAMTYVSYKLLDWPSTDLGALDSQGRGILRFVFEVSQPINLVVSHVGFE